MTRRGRRGAQLEKRARVGRSGIEDEAAYAYPVHVHATVMAGVPLLGTSVARPRPRSTVSARDTTMGAFELVDAWELKDDIETFTERVVQRGCSCRYLLVRGRTD